MHMALKIIGLSLRDVWQELWTIFLVHLLFLLGTILILPGPPVMVALFYYGNRVAHGETADERDFLRAIRVYWKPAWRWGIINLFVLGILIGDYSLTAKVVANSNAAHWLQGLYVTLLLGWVLLQIFALPFLFEQEQPLVRQALRNSVVFVRSNLIFVLVLTLLLALSLTLGILTFMLTFVFGGALVAFAGNHAVLARLADP